MKSIRKVALACVASAMLVLPASAVAQGPVNQDTFFTFSQAVELPGTTLPAGTYFFQLADSPSNRHIVKVMSQDRSQLHATLLAIPYYSTDRPSDEPQVRFMETPAESANGAAATNAIKLWFYPGRTVGHEFIYPREQAMRIASRSGQSVLTTKTEETIEDSTVADADLTRVDRAGADSAVDMSNRSATTTENTTAANNQASTQTAASQPAQTTPATDRTPMTTAPSNTAQSNTARSNTAQSNTAQPAAAQTSPTPDRTMSDRSMDTANADRNQVRNRLPSTAGILPLLAVIGIGSVVGSRLLRRSRRV
jgi:hypothetical protein